MDTRHLTVPGSPSNGEGREYPLSAVNDRRFTPDRRNVTKAETARDASSQETTSDSVLNDMLVMSTIGTVVGTAAGAIGQLALVAADVGLFVASPLIAPLAMLGWGASVGAIVGTAAGAGNRDGWFSRFIRDMIARNRAGLVGVFDTTRARAIA